MWLVTYEDIEGRKRTRAFENFTEAAAFLDQVGGWLHRDTGEFMILMGETDEGD